MHKLIKPIPLLILMVLLISCGATTGSEPAAELSNNVSSGVAQDVLMAPALKPVEPLATAETGSVAENEDNMLNPHPQSGISDPIIGEAVTPVVVDLSQITPGADTSGEQIVAPAPGVPDPLMPILQMVKADLAKRLGIDIGEVGFVRSQAVNWPDSSLGCPQEGMMYMMVITPGYQIVLEAQGQQYYYHTGQTQQMFVYCENPPKDLPAPADQ